jgi:hypothetical protein
VLTPAFLVWTEIIDGRTTNAAQLLKPMGFRACERVRSKPICLLTHFRQ